MEIPRRVVLILTQITAPLSIFSPCYSFVTFQARIGSREMKSVFRGVPATTEKPQEADQMNPLFLSRGYFSHTQEGGGGGKVAFSAPFFFVFFLCGQI